MSAPGRASTPSSASLRARTLWTNIGEVNVPQTRGQAPTISFGKFKNLPTLAATVGVPLLLLLRDGLAGGDGLLLQPHASSTSSSAGR